jgi:hypothetical protein
MLAADQRYALAEPLLVHPDQRGAVPVLLVGHVVEDLGGLRKRISQPIGIGTVDAAVILFGRDGERQDLLLRKGRKRTATEAEDARQHE